MSWANSFAVGPTLVDVPEEFAKDYRQLVADYASDPPNNVTVDPQTDTVVHNCSQTFYVSGDFQNSIVTIILETSVTFRGNEERAQWFSGNIRQDIAKIFQSWGVLHGAVGGSGAMDPYNIISNKESTISMPTPSTQVPSAPPAITGNLLSAEDDDNTRGRPAWLIWTLVAGGVASLLACAAAIALVFRHYSSSKRIDSSAVMAGSDESLHTEASRRSLDEAGGWQERGTATFNNPLWSAGPDESINTGQTAAQDKHRHDPDDPDSGDMFMSRSPVASPETASCSSGPIMGQQTAWNEGHSRQQTRATFSMVTAPGRRSHERKKIAGGDADQPLLAEAAAICTDPSEPSSENRHGSDEFKAVRPADGTRYRPT